MTRPQGEPTPPQQRRMRSPAAPHAAAGGGVGAKASLAGRDHGAVFSRSQDSRQCPGHRCSTAPRGCSTRTRSAASTTRRTCRPSTPFTQSAVPVDWDQRRKPRRFDRRTLPPAAAGRWAGVACRSASAGALAEVVRRMAEGLRAMDRARTSAAARVRTALKLTSKPGESERDFRIRLQQSAREARDAEVEKLRAATPRSCSGSPAKVRTSAGYGRPRTAAGTAAEAAVGGVDRSDAARRADGTQGDLNVHARTGDDRRPRGQPIDEGITGYRRGRGARARRRGRARRTRSRARARRSLQIEATASAAVPIETLNIKPKRGGSTSDCSHWLWKH